MRLVFTPTSKIRKKYFWASLAGCFAVCFFLSVGKAKDAQPIPFFLNQKNSPPLSKTQLIQAVEEKLFEETNRFRDRKKLKLLGANTLLAKVAQIHSEDMLKRNYIAHYNLEGLSALERIRKLKPHYDESCGENLHEIFSQEGLRDPQAIAKQMMKDWIHSPDHLKNLISEDFSLLGLGCASNGFKIYCTQLFSGPNL